MRRYIKAFIDLLDTHEKLKEWCWFVFLSLAGMCSFAALAYSIKFAMFSF